MKLNHHLIFYFSLFLILSATACQGTIDSPAQAVEGYYQALVDKDQALLVNFSCAEWEPMALLEFDSFANVETSLEKFSCQTSQEIGTSAQVTCNGHIAASYQGEIREFPMNEQTFFVTQEGGEWRLCGYD